MQQQLDALRSRLKKRLQTLYGCLSPQKNKPLQTASPWGPFGSKHELELNTIFFLRVANSLVTVIVIYYGLPLWVVLVLVSTGFLLSRWHNTALKRRGLP